MDDASAPPELPKPLADALDLWPLVAVNVCMLLGALLPIYTASHASLRRPLNTLTPKQKRFLRKDGYLESGDEEEEQDEDEEEGEEDESSAHVESLTATDAMLFPVFGGITLAVLYFLIKWMDDPALLSRIMRWYFTAMGMFSVGTAFSHLLAVTVSYVFPRQLRDPDTKKVYTAGFAEYTAKDEKPIGSPMPLLQGKYALPFVNPPQSAWPSIWKLRRALNARWVLHLKLHSLPGILNATIKKPFWLGDVIGPVVGALVVIVYSVTGGNWIMSNIMGVSFSYTALQLMSPTTFPIATLLLGLLFVYDVVMVFYTPLMITVATKLDVPIKLLFPRPGKDGAPGGFSMLGLGDIVIPGLLMAMALRYDLWRFYEQKRLAIVAKSAKAADGPDPKLLKPVYETASGGWGERFWGAGQKSFPKPYFHASVVGYVVGMVTTILVMTIFKHGQPALLYLCPSTLGMVWGTALVKGEVKAMWHYTEEGEGEDEEREQDEEKAEDLEAVKAKAREVAEREEKEDVEVVTLRVVRKPPRGAAVRKPKTLDEELRDAERVATPVPPSAGEQSRSEDDMSGDTEEEGMTSSGSEGSGESESIEVVDKPSDAE